MESKKLPKENNARGAKNQVRIRGPKPNISVSCHSLDELETILGDQFEEAMQASVPELIYSQFQFGVDVVLPVSALSDEVKLSYGFTANPSSRDEDEVNRLLVSLAVAPLEDAKLKLKRQRAVSREILRVIQTVDGFRYLEKEAWDTKHYDGYRFKYLCRDSYQNKDRVSNRARMAAASDPSTPTKPEKEGRDNRLPTYDCRGSIFIKFSASQGLVDVIYQHFPVHRESMPMPASAPQTKKRAREEDVEDARYDTSSSFSAINSANASTPYLPSYSTPTVPFSGLSNPPKGKRRKQSIAPPQEAAEEYPEEDQTYDNEPPEVDSASSEPRTPLMASFDDDTPPIPPSLISPQLSHDPGDADFFQPSVVTRVPRLPGLSAQMKFAIQKSYSSSTSTDPSSTVQSAAKKERKASASKSSKPKLRTKTGCWTCRGRKLKCDEVRPVCGACKRSREKRDCLFPGDDAELDAAEELK